LLARKPVEGKAGETESTLLTLAEPALPLLPVEAYVIAPGRLSPNLPTGQSEAIAERPKGKTLAIPSSVSPPSAHATPSTSSGRPSQIAAIPVSRRKAPGVYGHASDYSWLQGIVNQYAPGRYQLIYCESPADDPLGGKVGLVEDARLKLLQTGDIILVEGDPLQGEELPPRRAENNCPRYRVRQIFVLGQDK
jgi:hypothetical protein